MFKKIFDSCEGHLKSRRVWQPLLLNNTLFTLSNFSGFIVVMFYGVTIFQVRLTPTNLLSADLFSSRGTNTIPFLGGERGCPERVLRQHECGPHPDRGQRRRHLRRQHGRQEATTGRFKGRGSSFTFLRDANKLPLLKLMQ